MFGSKKNDDKIDLCYTVCDGNSACVLNNTANKYECSCLAGYHRIGAKDASETSHTHRHCQNLSKNGVEFNSQNLQKRTFFCSYKKVGKILNISTLKI